MVSVGQLCDQGNNVLLTRDAACIVPINGEAKEIAKRGRDGLYDVNEDILTNRSKARKRSPTVLQVVHDGPPSRRREAK